MILSVLITVEPKNSTEKYSPALNPKDLVITRQQLEDKLKGINSNYLQALIVRTLPNSEQKKQRNYMKESSSFFTIDPSAPDCSYRIPTKPI